VIKKNKRNDEKIKTYIFVRETFKNHTLVDGNRHIVIITIVNVTEVRMLIGY
jgi:hypothetical protein